MHFELLVEDQSGGIALEFFLDKILGANNSRYSWKIHTYKGIGRIPKNLHHVPDRSNRLLLDNLPRLLRAYGQSLGGTDVVVVVVDSDNRDCIAFKQDLMAVLNGCNPQPRTLFRIAIEEGEAWLLGDRAAVKSAYPSAKDSVLDSYIPDSICGTWEVLADAVHPGGSARLRRLGYPDTGKAKCEWAREIAPHLNIDSNQSKSFNVFRDGIRNLARNS